MRYLTYGSSVLPSDHRYASRLSMLFVKGSGVAKWVQVFAMTFLASACTGGSDRAAPESTTATTVGSTTTTMSVATTTTIEPETTITTLDLIDEEALVYAVGDPTSVEAELETAFYRSWAAYHAGLADPSVEPPELELTQAGEALAESRAAAKELQEANEFALSGPQAQKTVMGITVVDEITGLVESCNISDGEFYSQNDPDTKIDGGIFTVQFSQRFEKIDGRWRDVSDTQVEVVEGIGGCASFDLSS